MFPSLATQETYVAERNFVSQKRNMFLPQVKNIFASRTQILLQKHMLPSLATMEAMLSTLCACMTLVPGTLFPRLATRKAKHFHCF